MQGVSAAETAPRVAKALKMVQLTGQEHKLPGQLSGGQQQRVAIARAIVIEPPLVLMDEPLSNLDAKLRIETRAEIRRIHTDLGRATIYVTHDQDEALSLADRIVVMKDGVAQQIAPPEEVLPAAVEPRRRALHGLSQRIGARCGRRRKRPRHAEWPRDSARRHPQGSAQGSRAAGRRSARTRRCWAMPAPSTRSRVR
jgi:ABC-type Fe3+/spermidine/putrescine transport system ATPase subunit